MHVKKTAIKVFRGPDVTGGTALATAAAIAAFTLSEPPQPQLSLLLLQPPALLLPLPLIITNPQSSAAWLQDLLTEYDYRIYIRYI
jgi:hypothetical protein